MLWVLWLTIFGFFFGGRIIETAPKTWKVEPRAIELAKEIAAARTERERAKAEEKASEAARAAESAAEKNIEVAEKRIEVEKERQVTEEVRTPPLPSDNSTDAIRAVAATIWGEARGEGPDGMLAVGCVIRNRAQSPGWWGKDWESVCMAPKQFSCWWDKQGARVRTVDETDTRFLKCLEIARSIVDGSAEDITGGADHYHTGAVSPSWSRGIKPVAIIGAHRFFRLGQGCGELPWMTEGDFLERRASPANQEFVVEERAEPGGSRGAGGYGGEVNFLKALRNASRPYPLLCVNTKFG